MSGSFQRPPNRTSLFDCPLENQHNAIGTAELCRWQDDLLQLPALASLLIQSSGDVGQLWLHDAKGEWQFERLVLVFHGGSLRPGRWLTEGDSIANDTAFEVVPASGTLTIDSIWSAVLANRLGTADGPLMTPRLRSNDLPL